MTNIKDISDKIKNETNKVFKGDSDVLDMILAALFAGGHVLLEDVPGTGKTVLAKSVAKSTGLNFSRIQCTPDLMPSDITGSSVWLASEQKFEFIPGPVMSQIVLVDELNRATPRTQAALLESMAEGQVSVDGKKHVLDKPFFVIATENPVESEGTFPLPEAQKDRFMMCISVGYPSFEDEVQIITSQKSLIHPVETIQAITTKEEILECMEQATCTYVDDAVITYIVSLAKETRKDIRIQAGVSPRGSIALCKAAQAYAAIHGEKFVTPEDVKKLALPVFRKRIIIKSEYILKGYKADDIITDIIERIPIPEFKAHV